MSVDAADICTAGLGGDSRIDFTYDRHIVADRFGIFRSRTWPGSIHRSASSCVTSMWGASRTFRMRRL